MLKLISHPDQKVHIVHLGFNRKPSTFCEHIDGKVFGFVPCIRILIVEAFQKVVSRMIYLDIQTHFSPYLEARVLAAASQRRALNL